MEGKAINPFISGTIGMASVMTLAILSALLVCLLLNHSFSKHIVNMLSMLAVGTLAGDALFHLIPHSLGLDKMSDDFGKTNSTHRIDANLLLSSHINKSTIIYKSALVVGSIYFFYLLNCVMNMYGIGHAHSHGSGNSRTALSSTIPHRHEAELYSSSIPHLSNPLKTNRKQARADILVAEHEHSSTSAFKSIPNIVWMVVAGDTLHNVTDGLALGASFSGSVSGGLSTTIAIVCHEIPHEIGDFVILLGAGLKVQTALFLTSVTYTFSFVGVYTGVLLGHKLNIVDWVFAVTAGMFLYIALVELIPDMIDELRESKDLTSMFCQHLGFIAGSVAMALIATYEDSIKVTLSS